MAASYRVEAQGVDADLEFTGSYDPVDLGQMGEKRLREVLAALARAPYPGEDQCMAAAVISTGGRSWSFEGSEGTLAVADLDAGRSTDLADIDAALRMLQEGSGPSIAESPPSPAAAAPAASGGGFDWGFLGMTWGLAAASLVSGCLVGWAVMNGGADVGASNPTTTATRLVSVMGKGPRHALGLVAAGIFLVGGLGMGVLGFIGFWTPPKKR